MEKARIFVADDDRELLALMNELLQDEGYPVTTLQVPLNAYEEITAALPDLIILDIMLLKLESGWRVLNKLKSSPETAYIPVVICSAAHKSLMEHQGMITSLGCYVIEKPFNIEDFLATIERALGIRHASIA